MRYRDKNVIVTGGGRGIGFAIAQAFLAEGANVVVGEIESELRMRAANLLTEERVVILPLDVGSADSIREFAAGVRNQWDRVDVLINNAGIGVHKSLQEICIEEWDRVINVNLRGPFLMCKFLLDLLVRGSDPAVINIASTRAFMSEPNTFPYSASKGGLVALTHQLAVSLANEKIRVNAISPGWIETDPQAKLSESDHQQHPAGRVGRPEDIAAACLFLAGSQAGFITGTNLMVDGGMTIKMIYAD